MGFVADIFSAVIDIVLTVVDIVIQIVEMIIEFIMMLLGYESTQTIEYFEVQNVPLFEDPDQLNPLAQGIMKSILLGSDIAADLNYASAFQTIKGNVRKFIQFIENEEYFEGFPTIESYITYPDHTELSDVLEDLRGVPTTLDRAHVRAVSVDEWIKYWLQENYIYDQGANELMLVEDTTSTSPGSDTDTVSVIPDTNHYDVVINDYVQSSDAADIKRAWQVDFGGITYNSGPDTYTIGLYDDDGDTMTFPDDAPAKPLNLHYIAFYYEDATPSREYIFIYEVGEGTYPTLDNPVDEININSTELKALPAIPLRINNVNFSSFAGDKPQQIIDLCDKVGLDPQAILDAILNDPGAQPGDIDHVYVNFGVRMWDDSQTGMTYLFHMFENLYPAQAVNQAIYNDAAPGEDKPQNNIIITTEDYKYLFQWSYITYQFTSLEDIDADSGSDENGIYYSDMSRFNADGILVYPYYSSSVKGTYNVGYKASTLTEVANFLSGSGTVNPGTTSGEATNWLQVTQRLSYNNPSPVLQDPDGSISDLIFLTPDMVYENNGSGVLRIVNEASEETTAGQSITYYRIIESGLEAYTVTAPIGSLRVQDGDSGVFKMVKFNLGNRDDLMVPFIYNFVQDLSNKLVTQLYLDGCHASIYIAHYEVIHQSGWGFLFMIILIIIIVIFFWYAAPELFTIASGSLPAGTTTAVTAAGEGVTLIGSQATFTATGALVPEGTVLFATAPVTGIVTTTTVGFASTISVGAFSIAWAPTLLSFGFKFAVNQIIKMAITQVAGKSPIAGVVASIAGAVIGTGVSLNPITYQVSFNFNFGYKQFFEIFAKGSDFINQVATIYVEDELDDLKQDYNKFRDDLNTANKELEDLRRDLFRTADGAVLSLLDISVRSTLSPMLPGEYFELQDSKLDLGFLAYEIDSQIDLSINPDLYA